MKKSKVLALVLSAAMVLGLAACGNNATTETPATETPATETPATETPATETPATETPDAPAVEEGKVFNIYAWNEEFKGFFEAYYNVPEGITVNWIINPSDGGAYQNALDEALMAQESADADSKVDMFLAEADYILKYADTDLTQDVKALGVTDMSNTYEYTVQAASDSNGVVKGVSFQCCPSALIYRRSIAQDVLGTDDPAEVQAALSDWDKFDAVAATAKEKGYYMIASFASCYRPYSNNVKTPWVDAAGNLQMDDNIKAWMAQTSEYVANGYCLTSGIWDDESNAQMFADGKTMCYFGPAWYYNFCMGNAMDPDKGCFGDWAIVEGPMAHFWGGTWLLAPTGSDNPTMLADVMNTFINDEDVCSKLVSEQMQFSNNKAVNAKFGNDESYGNDFLGGQNDTAIFCELAKNIKFENMTIYDQLCNEGLQTYLQEAWKGACSEEEALANFKTYIAQTYPEVNVNNANF